MAKRAKGKRKRCDCGCSDLRLEVARLRAIAEYAQPISIPSVWTPFYFQEVSLPPTPVGTWITWTGAHS